MDALTANRIRMAELLSALGSDGGVFHSRVNGVALLRSFQSCAPVPVLYEPCIVLVAQGEKRFHVPDGVLTYDARSYLVVTVPIPADCQTTVAPRGPFLGIAVRIDLTVLGELLLDLGDEAPARHQPSTLGTALAPPMDLTVSAAGLRLVEALASPADAKVLGSHLVRELLYRVLRGPAGGALRCLLLGSEGRAGVHRILERIHLDYASSIDLGTLARTVGMSSSALHAHFRSVTGTSPVQYLKTLRLHKARMLLVQSNTTAAEAADRVGYKSASQFSREFRRLFGAPPAEEAYRVRAAFGYTDGTSVPI